MLIRTWSLAVTPLALLLSLSSAVRVEISSRTEEGVEEGVEAEDIQGVASEDNPTSFRGGPRKKQCEVLSKAQNTFGQVCTVDEFQQKAWLAAVELDCVLNRAQDALDLLSKRFELEAQATKEAFDETEEKMECALDHERCRVNKHFILKPAPIITKGGDIITSPGKAAGKNAKEVLQAVCDKWAPATPTRVRSHMNLHEATPTTPWPTICDLQHCADGSNSSGQMYYVWPDKRYILLLPQPDSKGRAFGYKGSQVRQLSSADEVTNFDVRKINKGLWYASVLAMMENFTETKDLYFSSSRNQLEYHAHDPALVVSLVSNPDEGSPTAEDICIGAPNRNLIDSGNYREYFKNGEPLQGEDGQKRSVRPYWRMSKRSPSLAVAAKVVADSKSLPMGTISLDLNMSYVAQKFLDKLNLTKSSYGVIVDSDGRLMATTQNARELLFNESKHFNYVRCAKGMTDEELANCSWKAVRPMTLEDVADRTRHSGANLSAMLDYMFNHGASCAQKMEMTKVKVPKYNGHDESDHLIVFCNFGAVPGWGLFIGTEFPDITEAADIRVSYPWVFQRKSAVKETEPTQPSPKIGRELMLKARYEFSNEDDMRDFPTQKVKLQVENRGRIPIPVEVTVPYGDNHQEWLGVPPKNKKAVLVKPGRTKNFTVGISLKHLSEFGTYTGTVHIQANRNYSRGVCFPDPLVVKFELKAKEAKVIRVLKKLAIYGFLPLMIIVMSKVFHQHVRKHYKNEALRSKTLEEAISSVSKIAHPMVIIPAAAFKRLDRLVSHEQAQECHEAVWLYTVAEVEDFCTKHRIIFISHQWTAFDQPDPTNTQYRAMVMSLDTLRHEKGWEESEMYVWVDYTSIPQRHSGTQLLAINSLTAYASHVAAFVVVAPSVMHKDLCEACDKATYQCRAWCRAEQLAHLLVCGTANMYLAENDILTPLTSIEGWLEQSTYVFHGDLTCCRRKHEGMTKCDKEFLVTPMLGLWAQLCLRVEDKSTAGEEALAIHAAINDHLDEIFPRTFTFSSAEGTREQQLFGDLCARLADVLQDEDVKAVTQARRSLKESVVKQIRSTRLARVQSRMK